MSGSYLGFCLPPKPPPGSGAKTRTWFSGRCRTEAMVRCNRDHALISRLTTALAAMAEPTRNLRAEMDLSNTLADIGKLRLAGALDAMHATQGVPA